MRYFRDVLLLIVLIALGAGVVWLQQDRQRGDDRVSAASQQRHKLDQQIKIRAATKTAELNVRGWPTTVRADWFDDAPPINPLLDADRPWIEIAPPEHAGLEHPPVRMTVDSGLAAFWYNPYNGSVRARVPVMVSDEAATSLYNRVNYTVLASIFQREKPAPQLAAVALDKEPHAKGDGAPSAPPAPRNDGKKRAGSTKNVATSPSIATQSDND